MPECLGIQVVSLDGSGSIGKGGWAEGAGFELEKSAGLAHDSWVEGPDTHAEGTGAITFKQT